MNKKKGIAVAVVLLLILLIGGMLAYFTDTDSETNVFVLGDEVKIRLDETAWDALADTNNNDIPDIAEGIHPGTEVAKDPVVVNTSTTTPAYVFLKVTVPCYDAGYTDTSLAATITRDTELFTLKNLTGANWTKLSESEISNDGTKTYVYYYGTASGLTALEPSQSTSPLFTAATLKSTITSTEAKTAPANPNIEVSAYAIQTDGLSQSTPAGVYSLYTTQNP